MIRETIGDDIVIYNADCREVLPSLVSRVSHVITDPPFGIDLDAHAAGHVINGVRGRRIRTPNIEGDDSTEVADFVISWADEHDLPLIVFCSPYKPLLGQWRNVLVWDKGPAVGGNGDPEKCWKRTFELICTRRNRSLREGRHESVLNFPISTGPDFEFHPCQKPVPLLRYLIRQTTDEGETILDPAMGSGSTGIAAIQEGRPFIGIELDPTHYATARRRLTHAAGKSKDQLFGVLE